MLPRREAYRAKLTFTWLHGESKAENLTLLDYLPVKPNKVSVEPTLVTDLLPKEAQFYCACGPKPMLKGLHSKWGTNGFVSLEERMSCGFGACYGCVIPPHLDTKGFVKKDPSSRQVNCYGRSCEFKEAYLENPFIASSGTCGYADADLIPLDKFGAAVTKTITLLPRQGTGLRDWWKRQLVSLIA